MFLHLRMLTVPNIVVFFVLLALAYISADEFSHFNDTLTGRISWVIDETALPWTGAYHFLDSKFGEKTSLLTIVDSSNGNLLAECTATRKENEWRRFFWTLSEDALLCNVSNSLVSTLHFPPSEHPRTFSVRILAGRGPQCFRDMIVQNERPKGCPPVLNRNSYQHMSLACSCPFDSTEETVATTEHAIVTTGSGIEFPLFELTPPSAEEKQHIAELAVVVESTLRPNIRFSTGDSRILTVPRAHSLPERIFTTAAPPTTTSWTLSAHPCAVMTCENNGTCLVDVSGKATCYCAEGYSGSRCEFDICATLPCMNGGVCRVESNKAFCECRPGFTGTLCEQHIKHPEVKCNPECGNGGTCVESEGAGKCQCGDSTFGINCNVNDVCKKNHTICSVYGAQAQCKIQPENYLLVSPVPVDASHQCLCPNENNEMEDCLEILERSIKQAQATPDAKTTSTDIETSSTEAEVTASAMNSFETSLSSAGIDFPVIHNLISPNTTERPTTEEVRNKSEEAVPFSTHHSSAFSSSKTTESPSQSQLSHEVFKNGTVVFPLSSFPSNEPTSEETTTEVTTETEPTSSAVLPNHEFGTSEGVTSIERPTHVLEMPLSNTSTSENVSSAPPFEFTLPLPNPTLHELETTDLTEESVTTLTTHEEITVNPHDNGFGRFSSSTVWPPAYSTDHPHWSESSAAETTPTIFFSSKSTERSIKESPETTTDDEFEEKTKMPPWLEVETTTTEPIEATENSKVGGSHPFDQIPHFTRPSTAVPSVSGNGADEELSTHPPYLSSTETVATETPSQRSDNSLNARNNEAPDGSAKNSSASWVIAVIAVIILLMLLGAAGLFVLRYVKRSRKLHGKYNPAREENALSSSYSMPMTTVTKEERLI